MKLFSSILRLRWVVICLILAATIYFSYQIPGLKINPDVVDYLPAHDEDAKIFKEIGNEFGGNFIGIVGVQADDIFTPPVMTEIRQITDTLSYQDGISYVTSLTNIMDIRDAGGWVEFSPLIDEYEITGKEELQKLRQYVLSNDMYRGSLVSEDGTTALVIIRFAQTPDKMQVIRQVKNKLDGMQFKSDIYIGGLPFMLDDLSRIISRDMLYLAPLAFLLIALILFTGFRTLRGILLPLSSVLIAIIWVLGTMSLLGYEITLVTNVVPVILLAVGSAYCIHVLNRVRKDMAVDPKKGLVNAMKYIAVPVFFAALTTAFGFISFIFGSYLTMIRDFGILTALGVIISLLLSLTLTPALLSFSKQDKNEPKESVFSSRLIPVLQNNFLLHSKKFLIVWLLIAVAGSTGLFRIERKFDLATYFHKHFPVRQTEAMLKQKFGGTLPVFVAVEGDIRNPDVLNKMKDVEEKLKSFKGISNVQSIVGVIEKMNGIMGEGKQIPDSKDKVMNLWFLLEGQTAIEQMVAPDAQKAIIQGMYSSDNPGEMKDFITRMKKTIQQTHPANCTMKLTGFATIYEKIDSSLLTSQIKSLLIALVLVFIAMLIILKDFTLSLVSTTPVIATLLVLFGSMGWLHIPLDMATVLVGSISIGIGIDYAIHFVSQLKNEMGKTSDLKQAIIRVYSVTGNSILINVLSVSTGFVALLFSALIPLQRFGILVIITMISSGLATLTLLPSLLIVFRKFIFKQHKDLYNEKL